MSGSRPTVGIRISAEGAEQARKSLEALGASGDAAMRRVAAASAAAAPEMQRLATASDVAQRVFVGMGGSLGRVGSTFTGVSGAASGLTAGFLALGAAATVGAAQIAKAGDEATATLARLASASGGLTQAQQVYERLFALSQQTGVAVAESAGSFARFAVAAGEIGATNDQVLRLVAGIQKAGIVAGSSAQETSAAVQQLGQALASGKLQGDELRSLLEGMPQLAQALARELGVSIGQLRQMGSEGQLTADKVFPALLRASEKMGEEFAKMPVTMSRAKDILLAATEDFGARLDRITGLSQTFARFMQIGAAALNTAGRTIAPTEREAADQAVETARDRVNTLRSRRPVDYDERIARYRRPGMTEEQARRRAITVEGPGGLQGYDPAEMAKAEADLREAMARQAEIRRDARELQRAEEADAAERARQAAQTAATLRLKDTAADLDARYKARKAYDEAIKKLDEDEARGGTLPDGVTFAALRKKAADELAEALKKAAEAEGQAGEEARKAAEKRKEVVDTLDLQIVAQEAALAAARAGTDASREAAIALEIEEKIRAAGIPTIERRTAAEKKDVEVIIEKVRKLDGLKVATDKAEEAAKRAKDHYERSWNALADIPERAIDRLGDSLVQAFVMGEGAAVNFGNVTRGILASVVSDLAKLAVINPILNSLFVSTNGARPTLAGAFGGGGFGVSDMLGIGQMLGGKTVFESIGLTGAGGFLSTPAWGATAIEPSIATGFSGVAGSAGASWGSVLGAGGLGFGAGMLTNNLLGGNQTGGAIGSALGAGAGLAAAWALDLALPGAGTLLAILGGAAGGGLGGLFGPGPSVKGYGYRFQAENFNEAGPGGWGEWSDRLKPIDYTFYNEEGKAAFQEAERQVAATNAYLDQRGLRVAGASVVGGNKDGADYSWADSGTIGEGFSKLRFAAIDNADLDKNLRLRNFQGVEGLAAYVEEFIALQDKIKGLTGEPVAAYTASIEAVNKQFEALRDRAKELGVSTEGLAEAWAKANADIAAARTETLRQSGVALNIRRLVAGGNTQEAELARQAEAARQEMDSFAKTLDSLALTAADKAARLVDLEQTQAAERAAIISRYGEQAAQALRAAGGTIRAYLDALATGAAAGASPTDRLATAQANFERDRLLATGGDRDALARITTTADQLLGAGRDVYASGSGFQAILASVKSGLTNLPVVKSYDAEQAATLAQIQQLLATGTLNTQTVILQSGNIVQLANGHASPELNARLDAVVAGLGNVVATLIAGFGQGNAGAGNIVATLVNGLGTVAATTGNGLATVVGATTLGLTSLNQSLATIHAATADLNTSLATIHASVVNGAGVLAAGQDIVAMAMVAANDNILTSGAALQAGQVVANGLLSGLRGDVLATGTAQLGGLANLNQSLATIHKSVADVNTSIATVHGSLVSGLNVVAIGGDIIAKAVVAAGAQLQLGQAVANQIEVGNANAVLAQLGAANQTLSFTNSYASFIDNTLKAANNYAIEQTNELRGLRAELKGLRAELAEVKATLQQVGVVTATETRAAGAAVVSALDDQTNIIKRAAA